MQSIFVLKKTWRLLFMVLVVCTVSASLPTAFSEPLELNDLGYFEKTGLNVLVFSNAYDGMFFDEKTAGIELIHHGVRTATGGAVRLQHTPEQWDLVPRVSGRRLNPETGAIEVLLQYPDYQFESRIAVVPEGEGVTISVYLDEPVPEALEGNAGFNMEFLPASYFEKTYIVDGEPGIFPLYPAGETTVAPVEQKIPQYAGHTTFDDRGRGEFLIPHPLASGHTVALAPGDPERHVVIRSETEIMLFDGRILAQNGWFIVRSLLPAGKTGKVLEWSLEASTIPKWTREPVIQFSQVGYHPVLDKIAVIELDKNDKPLKNATLYKVDDSGEPVRVLKEKLEEWGQYLRYNYVTFDFSSVKEPGVYYIEYGDQRTNAFPIDEKVFENVWQPTLDVFMAVQMDHMAVNEAYRVWHGLPYMDDALQAPPNHQHFDGYRMGPETETKYKAYERIPGMAVGGWFDAGDFDIQTGTHCRAIMDLVAAWEDFGVDRDQTYISQEERFVDIHRPDGQPDVLQQLEHGALNLVAQVKNIGHPVRGIIVPNMHQYHHLGDAAQETDNLPYNPDLKPYETDGVSSGTMDDRWAFTGRSASMDYSTVEALAAASRALKEYNDEFAKECLDTAVKLYEERLELDAVPAGGGNRRGGGGSSGGSLNAVFQLYLTTGEEKYQERFEAMFLPTLQRGNAGVTGFGGGNSRGGGTNLLMAMKAIPVMGPEYKEQLRPMVERFKEGLDRTIAENPFGVPASRRGSWGGNGGVVSWATTNAYAAKYFPDIVSPQYAIKGLEYLFGCHPYSNLSFVSAVGAKSKKVAYGNNRADFSFIAGGVVPGLLVLEPDFPENKEDWPFFWGENEYVVSLGTSYIVLANAVNELLEED